MKMKEAFGHICRQLHAVYEESESANIAYLLLEDATGLFKTAIVLSGERELEPAETDHMENGLQRLLRHEPIQYVMRKAWFYGLQLYVDSAVLIPRPETEELVDWVVKDVKASGKNVFEKSSAEADATTGLKILDVGTGSGCIALALKKTMPKAEVWGCDASEEALNVARRNGSELDIRVDFQGIDFLDEAQQKLLPTVDIIASNPPYIPLREKGSMNANVVNHEPYAALFVPDDDALLFYKAIAAFATKRLYEGGVIYLEIHENLGEAVVNLFRQNGYEVELKKDMQGKDRMVKSVKRQAPIVTS